MKTARFYLLAFQANAAHAQAGDRIWCISLRAAFKNPPSLSFCGVFPAYLREQDCLSNLFAAVKIRQTARPARLLPHRRICAIRNPPTPSPLSVSHFADYRSPPTIIPGENPMVSYSDPQGKIIDVGPRVLLRLAVFGIDAL